LPTSRRRLPHYGAISNSPATLVKSHQCRVAVETNTAFLRKVVKIVAVKKLLTHSLVAIRCHILRLKCTKFDFGCDSVPDPAGGAQSGPPDLLVDLRGLTSKEREGEDRAGGRQGKGRNWRKAMTGGRGRERRKRKGWE